MKQATSNKQETKPYKNLLMWQKSNNLVLEIYKITKKFPTDEKFGVTSQLRRASLSIPLNIVEGYARRSSKEFRHFLNIALGSLAETEYLLELCTHLSYISETTYKKLEAIRTDCSKLIWSYRNKINKP